MKIDFLALALNQLLYFNSTLDDSVNAQLCDLSQASQPLAPIPLPSPDPSLVLKAVHVGRGVQNYACSSSSPSSEPAAIGALATLFNVSCVAADHPDVLTILPTLALQIPVSNLTIDISGQHFFLTNTTPAFDLTSPVAVQNLGFAVGQKVASSDAPGDAPGEGYGAVAWLYLNTTNATVGGIREIYRVNTAGGNPPSTCSGMPVNFDVDYAAEYWFYGIL